MNNKISKTLNTDISKYLKADVGQMLRRNGKKDKKSKTEKPVCKISRNLLLFAVFSFLVCGFLWGALQGDALFGRAKTGLLKIGVLQEEPEEFGKLEVVEEEYKSPASHEQAVIEAVKKASPSVVSIIVSKEMPVYEQVYDQPFKEVFPGFEIEFGVPRLEQKGTEKQRVGGGTGFIVSPDGLILTNKHVAGDSQAEYTIITYEGRHYTGKVLAKDPFQDLAILKIETEKQVDEAGNIIKEKFPVLKLGNSDGLQIGQSVIAIGYALGEFSNTVSVGIVSGLWRNITATGDGFTETLENVIQTDAAINKGNSGGPLLNLRGEVIGVSVAMAETAQSIGFAIPINDAKRDIEQVKAQGKIVYPFLGVVYRLVTLDLQEEEDLELDYGAWIVVEEGKVSVIDGSAADKAGLKQGDVILEVDGEKVTMKKTLATMIRRRYPGDKVILKVWRGGQIFTVETTLGEKTSEEE